MLNINFCDYSKTSIDMHKIFMLAARTVAGLDFTCHNLTGSSGNLKPDVFICILE